MRSLNSILKENLYNERDLVNFGNYVLSDERLSHIINDTKSVYDADLANWKDKNKIKGLVQHVQESIQIDENNIIPKIKS